MKNWIIFKEINSDSIKGLLISELPSISKPKMRTETTVIDGRDGDIVDYLGYSSYDKTMLIGLTRDFDIDEVIKYFSGKGTMIFSNEPNKVYNVEITDSISYERLLKFRTATIKLNVQPYKYLLNELSITLDITNQTSLMVNNVGLEESKPIITLYGEGFVEILINDKSKFKINIDDEYVTINSLTEEYYKDSVLKSRKMTGIFPLLEIGENKVTWVGNLTKIIVEPKSRWL